MSDLYRRFGFLICVAVYTVALIALHAAGRFPAPGLYDVSHLIGSPSLTVRGRVLNFPMTRWQQTRFLMYAEAEPLSAFQGRVAVSLNFPLEDLSPDDELRVRGWLSRPRAPTPRRTFDERAYWSGYRAYAILHVWSQSALERIPLRHSVSWTQRAWTFHQRFQAYWFQHLPYDEAALLSCINLGSRGILPLDIKQQCIRAGVYHILVVSGQKMALIIVLGVGLLRMLHVPRRWALWICCPPIVFYTYAVGADPPVVRAATMAIVALGVVALGRDVPGYYPFVLAWFWILLWEPECLFGASFQLSFGATGSLLAVFPLLRTRTRIRQRSLRWVVEAGEVSFAVHVGVWPLLIYYFHQLSLAGVLANWTLFPLSGLILVLGLFIGVWGVWMPTTVPGWALQGMHQAMRGTLIAIQQMSGWKWAAVPLAAPSWEVLSIYYLALICILFKLRPTK